MKKLFVLLSALILLGFAIEARAESSATLQSGKKDYEQRAFIIVYNNSSYTICSGQVVVWDTAESATSPALGAYIKMTTTANDKYVAGVADEAITTYTSGRICIRGPHDVEMTGVTRERGGLVSASATQGKAQMYTTADGTLGGIIGTMLGDYVSSGADYVTVWVNPRVHK